jgi:outer membrane protein insertion porin family/translocation and assembly module TamA
MCSERGFLRVLVLAAAVTVGACREEGDIQIASIHFNGVEQIDEGALKGALQTREGSWIPWGRKRYFERRAFEADLKRIEAFYHDRGFPDARVASFDVALNDAQDKVSITVNISEGEPIRVAAVELDGFDVLSEGDRKALENSIDPLVDEPIDRIRIRAARDRALNELRDHGYPHADITLAERDAGPRQRRLIFQANPGVLAHFGNIEIAGYMSVGENTIRRQLTFKPGDLFSLRAMRDSQRQLYGLELFEFVNVEPDETIARDSPEVPVRVTVAEGKQQRVTFGVGYGSEEQVRARIRWDHVNFLGGAQHLGLEAKWSSLDRGVRAAFEEPFFLSPHLSLSFQGQAWQNVEPVYSLDTLGGRVTLLHQANPQNAWSVSYSDGWERSFVTREALEDLSLRDELIALGLDPSDGEFNGRLALVAFEASRNTSDNLLNARSGYGMSARVEQAGGWLPGSFNYWSPNFEARYYLPIGRSVVLANRVRAGTIEPLGADRFRIGTTDTLSDLQPNVPFWKRYFLGGSQSLRGWGRYEVGPTSPFGLPIGGLTMFEGSSEVRFPVAGRVAAVAFLDLGNAWLQSWDFNLNDLRYDVGPGLRYMTPVGPVRVDFGFQLNPIPNLRVNGELERRHWRVHFSIGQAF